MRQLVRPTSTIRPRELLLRLLLAVAAGGLQFLTYQPQGWWFCGFFAIALLLAAVLPWKYFRRQANEDQTQIIKPQAHNAKSYLRLWQCYLVTFTWFATTALLSLPWIGSFVGTMPYVALAITLGLLTLPTAVALWLLMRSRLPLPWQLVGAASAIVTAECLLARWPFGGFPWLKLAWGQVGGPLEVLARIGSTSLVSLAVALIGAAVLLLLVGITRRSITTGGVGLAIVGLILALVGGVTVTQPSSASNNRTLQVAAIQGNVPRLGLEFNAQRRAVLNNHASATKELAEAVRRGEQPQPDIVLWPENSSDVSPMTDAVAARTIDDAASAIGVPIIVGTFTYDHGTQNTMLLWDPHTGPNSLQRHEKIYLQPFGEYMPLRDLLRHVTDLVDLAGDMTPGAGDGTISFVPRAEPVTIGFATCFEVIFDAAYRDAVLAGAEILATPTNNATFGFTDMSHQQLAMSRLRAIEHHRAVVVAATSGISAIVAPDGTVEQQTEIFEKHILNAELPLLDKLTFATRYGRAIEMGIIAFSVLVLIAAIIRTRRPVTKEQPL